MSQKISKTQELIKRQADMLESFAYGKEYNIQEIAKFEKEKVSLAEQKKFCITDEEAIKLAKWCYQIEKYFSKKDETTSPVSVGTRALLTFST